MRAEGNNRLGGSVFAVRCRIYNVAEAVLLWR